MKTDIRPYDTSEYLRDEEDVAYYLEAIMEEDPTLLPAALGDVARARGMTELSRKTGLSREALYRSLSETGDPRFSTVCKVLSAYGVKSIKFGSSAPNEDAEAVTAA